MAKKVACIYCGSATDIEVIGADNKGNAYEWACHTCESSWEKGETKGMTENEAELAAIEERARELSVAHHAARDEEAGYKAVRDIISFNSSLAGDPNDQG